VGPRRGAGLPAVSKRTCYRRSQKKIFLKGGDRIPGSFFREALKIPFRPSQLLNGILTILTMPIIDFSG
jgi:hypothetical protein